MLLRPLLAADIDTVVAIEQLATEFPWSVAQFNSSSGDDCTVLEIDGAVLGFSIFQLVLDESSLLNIAVHPDYQGNGGGRLLLEQGLIQQARAGAVRSHQRYCDPCNATNERRCASREVAELPRQQHTHARSKWPRPTCQIQVLVRMT